MLVTLFTKAQRHNIRYDNDTESKSDTLTSDQVRVLSQILDNMVFVDGGTYRMGEGEDEMGVSFNDNAPSHIVSLDPFFIGKYEVTQEEWEVVMGNNPSYFKGNRLPVENVSLDDCKLFVNRLNQLTGKTFRLPTEAEWEYAGSILCLISMQEVIFLARLHGLLPIVTMSRTRLELKDRMN